MGGLAVGVRGKVARRQFAHAAGTYPDRPTDRGPSDHACRPSRDHHALTPRSSHEGEGECKGEGEGEGKGKGEARPRARVRVSVRVRVRG